MDDDSGTSWMSRLPWVMLGRRTAYQSELDATSAQPAISMSAHRTPSVNSPDINHITHVRIRRAKPGTLGHSYEGPFKIEEHLGNSCVRLRRLSPLLFIILMADLNLHIENSPLTNFADDTQSVIMADAQEAQ